MAKSFWMNDQKGNFSNGGNDTFDETKDYIGIRLQQGVPLLDRDWNELEDIRRYQDWVLREKYLGDGTPDNGFAITLIAGKVDDFNISMGRCLVDGFEAVNRAALTYLKQKDVPPLTIPPANRTDLVYIDLWISEIHGTDDLKNSQDVKIETSARQMIEWRVLVNETGKKLKQETFHHYYVIASMERNGALITSLKDLRTALRINPLFRSISVSEAGSIGIGTTDPKRMLHVEGSEVHSGGGPTAGFSFANRDAPNNGAYVENGADGLRWVWYARGQAAHLWAGGDKLVVDKNGNISASHGPQKGVKVADNVGLKLNSADGGGVICGFNLDHSIFFRIGQDGAGNVTDYHQFGTHRFFSGGPLETQAERMRITAGGAVGIGTTDPKRTLHVEGSEIHSGSGASGFSFANRDAPNNGAYVESGANGQRWVWYAAGGTAHLWAGGDKFWVDKDGNVGAVGKIPTSSDLRLKTSIEPLNDVLTRLEKIRAVYFEWNDVYRSLGGCSDRREIGLIAQEVEAVFPEAVMNWGDKGYLGIDYGRFSSILVEAVKELNSIIKGLNERIEHLEKKAAIT